jgi:ribosomal protein S27E
MKTRKQASKELRQPHFLLKCPECEAELVIHQSELTRVLFEPHEEEYEYWQGGFDDEHKKIGKRLVSSDQTKDYYEIKCCNCGHVWKHPARFMWLNRCNPDGEKTITFELNEVETKRAHEFIEAHSHQEELNSMGRSTFSAMGHQFTYMITPGGLGSLVSIKCNLCNEVKDITDTDSW